MDCSDHVIAVEVIHVASLLLKPQRKIHIFQNSTSSAIYLNDIFLQQNLILLLI